MWLALKSRKRDERVDAENGVGVKTSRKKNGQNDDGVSEVRFGEGELM